MTAPLPDPVDPAGRHTGPGVRVRVPASSANLGPGFDSIGLALGLWDEYDVTFLGTGPLRIEVTGEGAGEIPLDEGHLVHRAMRYAWGRLGVAVPEGVVLRARNAVPHGRGLGSSATAIVAGVVAAQAYSSIATWAGSAVGSVVPVDLAIATDLSTELEGHPDNASASVYGGMTVSWAVDEAGVPGSGVPGSGTATAQVALHPDVTAVVFLPTTKLATHRARAVLPDTVPHVEAARDAGRAALLVEAMSRRPDLLLPATRDWLHQEYRREALGPSMDVVDDLRARGHAALISGAGPSVLVLTTRERAGQVRLSGDPGSDPAAPTGWSRLEPGIPQAGVGVSTYGVG